MEPSQQVHSITEPAGSPLGAFHAGPQPIPKQFGKFKILDLVHRSQMSMVYKAQQEKPSRTVALKIPLRGRVSFEESHRRFAVETQMAADTFGAGIVPVLEAGEVSGVPFYTMPFIEGRSFSEQVQMAKLDLGQRLDLFLRLCRLVQKLHAQQLVHLDLKPGNAMVDRAGDVWLLDFGISRSLVEKKDHAGSLAVGGTPPYMAPEQTYDRQPKSPATDVHALGVMLYELLTDASPFDLIGRDREEIFRAIRSSPPQRPSARKRDLPDRYDALVLACLSKEPQSRPQTAGELARLLGELRAGAQPTLPAVPARKHRVWPALAIVALLLTAIARWLLLRNAPVGDLQQIAADAHLADVPSLLSLVPPAFPIELGGPNGTREFIQGEPFRFQARSDRECFMAFFLHSRDGHSYLLAPDALGASAPQAARALEIESKIKVGQPFGLEVAQVIACTSSNDYRWLLDSFHQGMSHEQFAGLFKAQARGADLSGLADATHWSAAYMALHTRQKGPLAEP